MVSVYKAVKDPFRVPGSVTVTSDKGTFIDPENRSKDSNLTLSPHARVDTTGEPPPSLSTQHLRPFLFLLPFK